MSTDLCYCLIHLICVCVTFQQLQCCFNFRFYFVGDEDLLEIIGNSKNVAKLQKHFKKMFAGVSSIILNEDNSIVLGISSREGEEVVRFMTVTQKTSLLSSAHRNSWVFFISGHV